MTFYLQIDPVVPRQFKQIPIFIMYSCVINQHPPELTQLTTIDSTSFNLHFQHYHQVELMMLNE